MKRRDFVKVAAGVVTSAPVVLARPGRLLAEPTSLLAIASHPTASSYVGRPDGQGAGTFTVNTAAVNTMVDRAAMTLSGKSTAGQAWEALLSARGISVSASTKIGIKINTAFGMSVSGYDNGKKCPYGAHAEVVNAIVSGLTQMLGGTFPISNITVFDKLVTYEGSAGPESVKMVNQGFPVSTKTPYDVSGPTTCRIALLDSSKVPANATSFVAGPAGNQVTQRIMPEVTGCQAYINIGVPKVNVGAGVTGCLKNTYGMTHDCSTTHGSSPAAAAKAPGICECVPAFYKEINARVPCIANVLDALAGNYNGEAFNGPSFVKNVIAMSNDPVTLDYYAVELVNAARVGNKLSAIDTPAATTDHRTVVSGGMYPGSRNADGYINAHYLAVAAAAPFSLGAMNQGDRRLVDVTGTERPDRMPSLELPQARVMTLSRGSAGWALELVADASGRRHIVESRVLDLSGRSVRSFGTIVTRQSRSVIGWDGRSDAGVSVRSGVYSWEVTVDGHTYAQTVRCGS